MRIRDASSIVLVDNRGSEPLILMGRRASAHVFMPNVYVFPGGRVDYADRFVPHTGDYADDTLDLLLQKMAGRTTELRARMFGIAAIRETFEEVGLKIGTKSDKRIINPSWNAFSKGEILPDLSKLYYLARAITPPGQKRRYDTRFFTCDVSDYLETQVASESEELEDVQWVSFEDAKSLKMHFITTQIIATLEEAYASNKLKAQPETVRFYRAKPKSQGKAKLLTLLRVGSAPHVEGEIQAEISAIA